PSAGTTGHASHTGTKIGLGRLEPVRDWGRTFDLTGVPASRKVHLAQRETERRKAGREPGSHRGTYFRTSRVCLPYFRSAAATRLTEDDPWGERDCSAGFATSRTASGNEVDTKETLE